MRKIVKVLVIIVVALLVTVGGWRINMLWVERKTLQNQPPTPIISSPTNNSAFLTTDNIYFNAANSFDPEDDVLIYYWTSNVTGFIGNSSSFHMILTAGNHQITLYINDGHNHNISASVKIIVTTSSKLEIWNEDKFLEEDYTIEENNTLIINPGTTVYLSNGVSINVYGSLIAEGREDNIITFTHNSSDGYWDAIKLFETSKNCSIKYCKLEYGGNNDYYYYGAIYCCSPITITHCVISNTTDIAITCWSSGSPNISNNTITNNEAGIFCLQSSPEISNNNISNNTQYGIMVREYSFPNISHNKIYDNGATGVMCLGSSPTISYNTIFNHQTGISSNDYYSNIANPIVHQNDIYDNTFYGMVNYGSNTINASYNFWGSADGPSGAGTGNGDKVSENITYEHWFEKPVTVTNPVARFTFSPLHPNVNETISFNDTSIDNGFIISWFWSFGDGNVSNEQNMTHKYYMPGTYTVTLTVTDNNSEIGRCTKTINVGIGVYLLCLELEYPLQVFEDVDSFNFTCAVPCNYEEQVPIFFEVCNDTTANITGYGLVSQDPPNNVINFTIAPMEKYEKVILHLKYWVLVKNKHYDDLPEYVEMPKLDDIPEETKIWLESTNAIQSNNSEVIETANQIRNNNSNLIEVAENISEYMREVPVQGGVPQDALSALHYGGVCTGHANLGTALFRANNIPAKDLIVIPTGGGWLQWHFISEYYCPDYGWVWVETSLGQTPFEPKNDVVIRVNYPEDENEAGVNHGGVEQIYWLSTDNVFVVYGGTDEMSYTGAWSESESFVNSECANNAFLITQSVHSLYINYTGKNLSDENKTHFENAISAQKTAIEFLSANDLNSYIEKMCVALDEYNAIVQ